MCSLSQEFAGCHPTTIGVDDYQNFGSNLYVYRGTSFFVSYLVRMLFKNWTLYFVCTTAFKALHY